MYIQPNKLLQPTSRVIKPYACAMIATEGPNIIGKLDLAGVEIQYDTQSTTRLVLQPNMKNQPLFYYDEGATFLILKITYDETNPMCVVEEFNYIEYYFNDSPNSIRYINKLLILSGNSLHKIPNIFLNNPTDIKVVIDVMVANIISSDISLGDIDGTKIFDKLIHGWIISNVLGTNNESSQLRITDHEGVVKFYLDYESIDVVQPVKEFNKIEILTKTNSFITLIFMSQYEMYQSFSRIEWVLKGLDSQKRFSNRILTPSYPDVDITKPLVYENSNILPIIGNIYALPPLQVGHIIDKNYLINYFIDQIYDAVDGDINKSGMDVVISSYDIPSQLSHISINGIYDVTMSISDNANNNETKPKRVIVNINELPIINFSNNGNSFIMSIINDATDPLTGITSSDIIYKTITNIEDSVSKMLSPTIYTENQLSGITFTTCIVNIYDSSDVPVINITTNGTYKLSYVVTDLCGVTRAYTNIILNVV